MIPKTIHYCWFGRNPIPQSAEDCINSWKKYCPDYEIRQWDETNVDLYSFAFTKEAYEAREWAFVPDLVRLFVIFEHGGIYLDTDVELIRPLDELLDNSAFIGMEGTNRVNLGAGFGAEKGHPLIRAMLEDYTSRHFKLASGDYDKTPSPEIQTELLKHKGFIGEDKRQVVEGATIYPSHCFSPISYETGVADIQDDTYGIHHFSASWLPEGKQKLQHARWSYCRRFGPKLGLALYRSIYAPFWLKIFINEKGLMHTIEAIRNRMSKNN